MLNDNQEDLSIIFKRKVNSLLNDYSICKNYESFKEGFKQKQNFYLNYFYFFFGQHYESIINNVNFFHYATESLILEILKKLDKDKLSNIEDEETLNLLKFAKIDANSYYDNIKLLTGSCYLYDQATKLSEMKIANIFLDKFNFYKEKYFSEKTLNPNEKHQIPPKSFKTALITLAQMSASSALAELNIIHIKEEFPSKETLFYDSYHNSSNSILLNYIKNIQKHVKRDSIILKDNNKLKIVKMFYFYCKTTFEDYMHDIDLFNDHSKSLFEKIKKISLDNFDKFNSNFNTMINKSKALENLKYFYNYLSDGLNDSTGLVKSKLFSFKIWINESISTSPNFFYEQYKMSKLFIYNKVLKMGKNILVLYSDRYITFLMTNLSNVKKTMDEVTQFFLSKADLFMTNFENKINERELCIKFSSNEDVNFIKVDVDNTVMMINPKKFKEYAENFYNHFAQSSYDLLEKSKNYIMSKYKLFLGDDEKNLAEK